MKERIVSLLHCTTCGGELELLPFSWEDTEVKDGLLTCTCGSWFPITDFIPRFLPGHGEVRYREFVERHGLHSLKQSRGTTPSDPGGLQVQRSFGAKWTSQPHWGTGGETRCFSMDWILQKYGWKDSAGFERAIAGRKRILDAGTGLGRVAIEFCETCKGGEVFAVDFSEAVTVAYENTRPYPNAHVVQADVMRLPFRERSFDFIFSEGVLHHTPDTRKAFAALLPFLAPGGEIAIYVYVKKGPVREFCDDFLRRRTTQLSEQECWEFSRRMTLLGKALSELKVELEIPVDLPHLEVSAGRYDLQRFFYYHIFKCFWNDRFTFDENNLVNFDWYHPFHAHRHTQDEVKAWFDEGGLTIAHLDVSESGITVRGRNLLSHGERRVD